MARLPQLWKSITLNMMGIPVSTDAMRILTAWQQSTPIQPVANNPLGMPAGTMGAQAFAGTRYAAFHSIYPFYAAMEAFARTSQGARVVAAMTSDRPYAETWRAVSDLRWPGGMTETDYPSKLLDLTEQSYRDSVKSADASERKTSGVVGAPQSVHDMMRSQAASLAQTSRAITDARTATRILIRRHAGNG